MTADRRRWVFRPEDRRQLDELLASFLSETGIRCAVMLDREGQLLTTAGELGELDGVSFASLAAADFAASAQIAELLGESDFSSLYHHGDDGSLYLVDLGGRAILAAIFDRRTTVGMVRFGSRSLVPRFAAAFDAMSSRAAPEPPFLESSWVDEAAGEIDRLFAE